MIGISALEHRLSRVLLDKSYNQEAKGQPNERHHKHWCKRVEIDFWSCANCFAPMKPMIWSISNL
jgi:hypothetical protein